MRKFYYVLINLIVFRWIKNQHINVIRFCVNICRRIVVLKIEGSRYWMRWWSKLLDLVHELTYFKLTHTLTYKIIIENAEFMFSSCTNKLLSINFNIIESTCSIGGSLMFFAFLIKIKEKKFLFFWFIVVVIDLLQ